MKVIPQKTKFYIDYLFSKKHNTIVVQRANSIKGVLSCDWKWKLFVVSNVLSSLKSRKIRASNSIGHLIDMIEKENKAYIQMSLSNNEACSYKFLVGRPDTPPCSHHLLKPGWVIRETVHKLSQPYLGGSGPPPLVSDCQQLAYPPSPLCQRCQHLATTLSPVLGVFWQEKSKN